MSMQGPETGTNAEELTPEQRYLRDLHESRTDLDYFPGAQMRHDETDDDQTQVEEVDVAQKSDVAETVAGSRAESPWPTEQQRDQSRPLIQSIRAGLAQRKVARELEASNGSHKRPIRASSYHKRPDPVDESEVRHNLAKIARDRASATGVDHAITRDSFGHLVVRPVTDRE